MDDPIEVVTADARLFPIFDEPGAGNLQAVIGETGQLLARGLTADPYAEEQYTITAPAVDEVKLTQEARPTPSQITLHITEPLDPTTIATGTRLAALAADGTLVRTRHRRLPPNPIRNTVSWTLHRRRLDRPDHERDVPLHRRNLFAPLDHLRHRRSPSSPPPTDMRCRQRLLDAPPSRSKSANRSPPSRPNSPPPAPTPPSPSPR